MGNNGKKKKIVLYNKNRFPESKFKQENLCYEAILKRITPRQDNGEKPGTDLEFIVGKFGIKIECLDEDIRDLHLNQKVNIYAGICGLRINYIILRAAYGKSTSMGFIEYKLDNAIISPISITSFY